MHFIEQDLPPAQVLSRLLRREQQVAIGEVDVLYEALLQKLSADDAVALREEDQVELGPASHPGQQVFEVHDVLVDGQGEVLSLLQPE